MAKSRVTTNPMYVGGAGGYSFYVRKGEQVIRQRKNNSNYGAGASRTQAQMIRRIKWGNLVNVFKTMKSWQPKAYDSKKQGQTDYNIFMALNINQATAALTREMCLSGCAVIESLQVSRGSLPPIALALAGSGNQYVSDIVISNAIQGATTVGQLSTDILANNPQFQEGDNLAFGVFYNWKDSRVEWPFASTRYTEITLDKTSATVVNSIPLLDNRLSKSSGGFLQASWAVGTASSPNNEVGMVLIHTRKTASMLAVSSQKIVMNGNSILASFVGNTWYQTCIDSYGLTDEVPLDPSFPEASIQSVTANGSAVSEGDTLEGSQELVITGYNLSSRSVKVFFDNVEYTPLFSGVDFMGFLLSDNGRCEIFSGGSLYLSFYVRGNEVPDDITNTRRMCQRQDNNASTAAATSENWVEQSVNCLNYPYKTNGSLRFAFVLVGTEERPSSEDLTLHNCTKNSEDGASPNMVLNVSVTDVDQPAWVEYKGFIVYVFNYE